MSLPLGTAGQAVGTNSGGTALTNLSAFVQGSSGANGIVVGTNTNDSAASGKVGEYIESVVGATSYPTSTQFGDLTSISLTAGDWDVTYTALLTRQGSTPTGYIQFIGTVAGNSSSGDVVGSNDARLEGSTALTTIDSFPITISNFRMSFSSTTIVYAKFQSTYTGGPPKAFGRLSARRVR